MARTLPNHLEAEQSVLGSIFLDTNLFVTLLDRLSIDDFYDNRHVLLYQAMIDTYNVSYAIDYSSIVSRLEDLGKLTKAGGIDYVLGLSNLVASTRHFDTYIELVKEASLKRQVIEAANKIVDEGYQGDIEASEYLASAEGSILALSQKRRVSEFKRISEIAREVKSKIETRRTSQGGITGLHTGFQTLDTYTLGLQPEELIILAARPSMGKSAFAMNLALNVAKNNKNGKATVAIFSLEMSNEQLVSRMISSESSIDNYKIRDGQIVSDDWLVLGGATESLSKLNIVFDDSAAVTVADIRAKCRKIYIDRGLDFVVIDYLQLIDKGDDKSRSNRQEEVAKISRSLKQLARELKIPILALSQLSREVDKREDKKPVLADLRESGSIEQDADIVLFLYRPNYYKKSSEKSKQDIAELSIAKNRQGISGVNIVFNFLLSLSRFQEQVGEIDEE